MTWDSQEPIVRVLHTVGNPIRKAAIEALGETRMRFSQLLTACGLSYDHDAGHFCYHLSELIEKRIVEKADDAYCLTGFGLKIAEMLRSLEKEYVFLVGEEQDEGGEDVREEEIALNWLSWQDFVLRFGKDISDIEAKLPQLEKEDLEKFKEWSFPSESRRYYHPRFLVARRGDNVLGFVETVGVVVASTAVAAAARVLIKRLLITGPALLHQRGLIAGLLLRELLRQAEEHGANSVEAINISAEDEELLTVFKRLGFERASVGYNLRKIFGRESLRFEPTIGPSAVSCWKCGGRRFRFLKKEESDEGESVVYACLRCGEEKRITSTISTE